MEGDARALVPADCRVDCCGAIEKAGNSCPLGFYASGNYCLSSPSNEREAIQKTGNSCPLGWFSSGSYCVNNH